MALHQIVHFVVKHCSTMNSTLFITYIPIEYYIDRMNNSQSTYT